MLHARIFAYLDAARYHLGANHQFLPTNTPVSHVHYPIERDGFMSYAKN
jgi:catalase